MVHPPSAVRSHDRVRARQSTARHGTAKHGTPRCAFCAGTNGKCVRGQSNALQHCCATRCNTVVQHGQPERAMTLDGAQVKQTAWVGFSSGTIRIFDLTHVDTVKKHEAYEYPLHTALPASQYTYACSLHGAPSRRPIRPTLSDLPRAHFFPHGAGCLQCPLNGHLYARLHLYVY